MADNALDIEVIFIGGGIGTRQHIFGVEDVKAFVLHRAHIEEIDGDDHVDVEVIFEAETLFVPLHGVDEGGHRPWRTIEVAAIDKQLQRHFATGTGGEGVTQDVKITCHQRKQVARFRERILPLHPMTAVFQLALTHAVAVGEQKRIGGFIGDDFSGEAGQHIRAVEIPGNVTETFGFTLGTERDARLV